MLTKYQAFPLGNKNLMLKWLCRLAGFAMLAGLIGLFFTQYAWADRATPSRLSLSQPDKDWLAAHPVIRLGIDAGYMPYSFLDEQGQLQGAVSEFLAYLGPVLGVRFEIVSDLDWPQLMEAVRARRIDAVTTVVQLPERDALLEFTAIYLPTPLVIMTRNDTPQLRSLQDLAGLQLTLMEGYSSSKQIKERYPELQSRYVATPLDGLRDVVAGRADAYVGMLGVDTFLAARHGIANLKVNAAFDMEVNGQRFGVRKDWPRLAHILDQALRSMHVEEQTAIFNKWMPLHAQEIQRLSQPGLINRLFPWLLGAAWLTLFGYFATLLWNRQLKRKLAQRQNELISSTDRLRAAEALAHVGNWQYRVAGKAFQWSDETYRIFGFPPQSRPINYGWLLSRIHPDDREGYEAFTRRMLESRPGETIPDGHYRLVRPRGEVRCVKARVKIEYDASGRPHTLFGTLQDVSEQKERDDELKRLHAILHALVEGSTDAIFVKDKNGRYIVVNRALSTLVGRPMEGLFGVDDYALFPPESADRFRADDRRIMDVGVTQSYEEPIVTPGATYSYLTTKGPLVIDGEVRGVFGIARDITGRKLAEAALQESESRLRLFIEHAPAALAMFDREMRYLAVSTRWLSEYRLQKSDILGHSHYEAFPDTPERWKAIHQRGLAGEVVQSSEDRLERADGNVQWLRWEVRPWHESDNAVGGILVFSEDITERVVAGQALRESEARYRSLLEMAPFPVVLTRVRDGILMYGNHRAEIQYGISREQGIGQPAARFYENHAERERFLEPLRKTGKVDDLEVRMRTAAGRPFWALVSASIVEFDSEPAIFTAINDITVRKQMEAALREQGAFFRLIAENIGDMVAVLDLEGRRLYNSPSYQALFGDPEALKGTDSFAEIHPEDRDRVRKVFIETVRTGQGHRIDFRFVLANGEVRHIESQGGVIRGTNGGVERVVVVSRDVTERRQMEDEIRQFNIELEERVRQRTAELADANKELETFTYSVSHDLKAPLRGIDGYSRLLLEDYRAQLDQPGIELVNHVCNGVAQMSQLIEDLLTYSRVERRSLHGQTLQLAVVMARVLEALQADIEAQGMVIDVSLQDMAAHADPEGLSIVLRNLVDNALKFSRDSHPPRLSISGARGEKSITLKFADNGIGFDMQFHHRIFEIFQRLQRAEDYPGTGIGLAIVYKAMQRMGGRVWAESAPGEGATFYLELPL